MSDFTALSKANESEDMEITNIAFFPAIKIKDVREAQRLDGTVTTTRLKNAIISSIILVNDDLLHWRLAQQAKGINSIEELSEESIDGKSKYLHLYQHAVYCWTNALINDQYLNYDATAKAVKQIEPEQQSTGDLYRDARYAIRDILGKSHSTMELV
jgi:hypothetical protein